MVGCGVLGCKSRSERKIDRITFHSFPSDTERKAEWLAATGRQSWEPTKYSKICSIHFDNDSFIYTEKRVLLKPLSVPKKNIHIKSPVGQSTASCLGDILARPSTSQQIDMITSSTGTKRKDNILVEVHNIQPKKLCLIAAPEDVTQSVTSTPRKEKLKNRLIKEKIKSERRLKKLRAVRECRRRLLKKSARLEHVIAELKSKMFINSEESDILSNIDTQNADFLKRFVDKENSPRKFSPSLRQFALCLHFIGPKAYTFVRKQFNTCLPHPKTLCKWYQTINCEPGFTTEALEAIKLIASKSEEKSLV